MIPASRDREIDLISSWKEYQSHIAKRHGPRELWFIGGHCYYSLSYLLFNLIIFNCEWGYFSSHLPFFCFRLSFGHFYITSYGYLPNFKNLYIMGINFSLSYLLKIFLSISWFTFHVMYLFFVILKITLKLKIPFFTQKSNAYSSGFYVVYLCLTF